MHAAILVTSPRPPSLAFSLLLGGGTSVCGLFTMQYFLIRAMSAIGEDVGSTTREWIGYCMVPVCFGIVNVDHSLTTSGQSPTENNNTNFQSSVSASVFKCTFSGFFWHHLNWRFAAQPQPQRPVSRGSRGRRFLCAVTCMCCDM